MKLSLFSMALLLSAGAAFADPGRVRSFDDHWRFQRGDAAGADSPGFHDASWRVVDLPHDWSIEDLPHPAKNGPAAISVTAGTWRYSKGDDAAWKNADFDDGGWASLQLPALNMTEQNTFGWFRRTVDVPASRTGKDLVLSLGPIDDSDETFFNGVKIGGTGPIAGVAGQAAGDYQTLRFYKVPAALVKAKNVLAVRVFNGGGNGGIYNTFDGPPPSGPWDYTQSAGGAATGYAVGGTGWYRKHFTVSKADAGKQISVQFDGVYMNADVSINGKPLGTHPYGYTTFAYDLTPYLNPTGTQNVLAVRVRNTGANSRWYSGSGIYRHVWLNVVNSLHVAPWGVSVTTPSVTAASAQVQVTTDVQNDGPTDQQPLVVVRLLDAAGKVVGTAERVAVVDAGKHSTVTQTIALPAPKLWSLDTPNLYHAEVALKIGARASDQTSVPFGVRTIRFDAKSGFTLNGVPIKLRGGCVHHDNGPLGAATIDRAEERRIELLKANGYNAVRTSHNPPSPAFLDACDRLGVLVIDEAFDCWAQGKNVADYHLYFNDWSQRDLDSMVLRDRNHPSIVLWSIGNEIPGKDAPTAKRLADEVRRVDPTRAVTSAFDGVNDDSDAYLSALDVSGYNYGPYRYDVDHQRHPDRVIVATESFPKEAARYWKGVTDNSWVIGDFVWTAIDYYGESGIGHTSLSGESDAFNKPWPWHNAWCGDLDICGFKKPQSYYRDVLWGRSKLEMAVHRPLPDGKTENISGWGWTDEARSWTWPGQEGKAMRVNVYTTCPQVRLTLNGRTIDAQPEKGGDGYTLTYSVPYAAGVLRAVGLQDGQEVASVLLSTAGRPKRLRLTADRSKIHADRNDLSYVTVEVLDSHGVLVPNAAPTIRFTTQGQGEVAATGNADPTDLTSLQRPEHKPYEGRCLAILRPKGNAGTVTLRAESDGLEPATLTVKTGE
ncbi:beta-galactosidase [Capsulimonas corticalis]|uniref:Beta-galactosidase n=1 Tax=Capsulimonas corticalis TaxID=2219043 RepID=A0A402D4L2_9BACT|nr:glycoside hydrolase family 2 TIM barrel-domain containing protein [Capsulimonas corticalis]BDI29256.1 beta-galactosidase [Capsulimonas corticalis]